MFPHHLNSVRDLLMQFFNNKSASYATILKDCENNEITVQQLKDKCFDLVSALYESKANCIAICMRPSMEFVITLCAAIVRGIHYIPIEPSLPSERIAYILKDSGANLLIHNGEWNKSNSEIDVSNVSVRSYQEICQTNSISNDHMKCEEITLESVFCLMYTSGSTGVPKGVRIPHRALINRLLWQWNEFPFKENEVCCMKTSISFVDSICEVLSPLLKCIPIVIIDKSFLLNPKKFIEILLQHKISRIVLVPTLLTIIVDHLSKERKSLPDLKIVVCSGETLNVTLINKFFSTTKGNIKLMNFYGSTEIMADATYEVFNSVDDIPGSVVDDRTSIGKPIANMKVHLLNKDVNGLGEICISGLGVTSGYHNIDHNSPLSDKFSDVEIDGTYTFLFRTGKLSITIVLSIE